jgi:hypothetical protein
MVEAPENRSLPEMLVPCLRKILLRLDTKERVNATAKRALMALGAFARSLKITIGEVEFGLDVYHEAGIADSGDLENDLPDLFQIVGQAAKERNRAVAIIIDELQYVKEKEFSCLIMAIHRVAQRQLPLILIGAGLPQLVGLAGKSKSYAERLFDYPKVDALATADASLALTEPARRENVHFSDGAVIRIASLTKGYPYFLQEWGYHSWNHAISSPISLDDVEGASTKAIDSLDNSFFRVRFDRLTPRERDYLFAMAGLGAGPHRSGDIAAELEVAVESVAPVRSSLIKKGMAYSPAHGDTAFTVPMFDEYLNRVWPVSP